MCICQPPLNPPPPPPIWNATKADLTPSSRGHEAGTRHWIVFDDGPMQPLPLLAGAGLSQVLIWFRVLYPHVEEQGVESLHALQPPWTDNKKRKLKDHWMWNVIWSACQNLFTLHRNKMGRFRDITYFIFIFKSKRCIYGKHTGKAKHLLYRNLKKCSCVCSYCFFVCVSFMHLVIIICRKSTTKFVILGREISHSARLFIGYVYKPVPLDWYIVFTIHIWTLWCPNV